MNNTEQQFFSLLRAGLWDNPIEEALFSNDPDWPAILKMASMQTVSGIIYDGISKLPLNCMPPAEFMRRIYQSVVRIDKNNQMLNERLNRIILLLQSEGIHPILLKGQGVALNYPTPSHRQCGDIDLYIGKKDYKRACHLTTTWGVINGCELESYKHFSFAFDGIAVEFHRIVEQLPNPFKNRKFQRWIQFHLQRDKLIFWHLGQTEIPLPPANFNIIYIFNHALRHFIADGIGLRQLCDWSLCLYKYHGQIDKPALMKNLKAFGLLRSWQIFGCVAVHELGLPKDMFPFYNEKFREVSQKKLLEDIMLSGNFGRYDIKWKTRPSGYLSGKFHNFVKKNQRLIHIFPIIRVNPVFYYLYYFHIGLLQIINDKCR